MPVHNSTIRGIVLKITPTGESHLRLHVLDEAGQLCTALFRPSRSADKRARQIQPDLFDEASLQVERKQDNTPWFVREYHLEQRHEGLGRHYATLQLASDFAGFLVRNRPLMDESPRVYELCAQALHHWETSQRPEAVYLKTLYLLARDEGYAVEAHWLAELRRDDQRRARQILSQPLATQPADPAEAQQLILSLKQWLKGHADFLA